jgi:hypothetical protein
MGGTYAERRPIFDLGKGISRDVETGPVSEFKEGLTEDQDTDVLSWNVVNLSAKRRSNILNNIGQWQHVDQVRKR